jgi:hypothetical protein
MEGYGCRRPTCAALSTGSPPPRCPPWVVPLPQAFDDFAGNNSTGGGLEEAGGGDAAKDDPASLRGGESAVGRQVPGEAPRCAAQPTLAELLQAQQRR